MNNTNGKQSATNNSRSTPLNKPLNDVSSISVSDSHAKNANQLLNAYIYDFLVKSKLPQTAKIFVNEAEIPSVVSPPGTSQTQHLSPGTDAVATAASNNSNNNSQNRQPLQSPLQMKFYKDHDLPKMNLAMDSPQSFLFEWWQMFWDIFQAKNGGGLGGSNATAAAAASSSSPSSSTAAQDQNGGKSNLALKYYQLQLLKQRQQQQELAMAVPASMSSFQQQQALQAMQAQQAQQAHLAQQAQQAHQAQLARQT